VPPHLVVPGVWQNLGHALNYGFEAAAAWHLNDMLKISPLASFLQAKLTNAVPGASAKLANSPKHQYQVRSTLNLWRGIEWDVLGGYSGAYPIDLGNGLVRQPSYLRLDTRIGWRMGESLEFSLAGQNLLTPRHSEFPDTHQLNATYVQRSIIGNLTWRF